MRLAALVVLLGTSLVAGWVLCLLFLDGLVVRAFEPADHEAFVRYWFNAFVMIEVVFAALAGLAFTLATRRRRSG